MPTVIVRTKPFRGTNYRAQREEDKVVVHAESATGSVRGVFNLSANFWSYDDRVPKPIKANIEKTFT